jgi:hypothetical protein
MKYGGAPPGEVTLKEHCHEIARLPTSSFLLMSQPGTPNLCPGWHALIFFYNVFQIAESHTNVLFVWTYRNFLNTALTYKRKTSYYASGKDGLC